MAVEAGERANDEPSVSARGHQMMHDREKAAEERHLQKLWHRT